MVTPLMSPGMVQNLVGVDEICLGENQLAYISQKQLSVKKSNFSLVDKLLLIWWIRFGIVYQLASHSSIISWIKIEFLFCPICMQPSVVIQCMDGIISHTCLYLHPGSCGLKNYYNNLKKWIKRTSLCRLYMILSST